MLSQAIRSSTNQINNQHENLSLHRSSLSSTVSPSSSTPIGIIVNSTSSLESKEHQNQQLYQHHHSKYIWPQSGQQHQHQYHRRQRFHWHQYPKPESQSTIFSLDKGQYHSGKGVNIHNHHHHHQLLTKLFQPTLRPSMNFVLTVLILNLLHRVPCTLATSPSGPNGNSNNANNNNLITNRFDTINSNTNKEIALNSNSLGNLEDGFSSSFLTHSRPVLLSPSTHLSQSYSPSSPSSSSSPLSSSASLSSPLSSSSTQPSGTEEATSLPVSPDSLYSFISSHHPAQLSHYYLQITKPQQSSSLTTSTTTPEQSINNNNDVKPTELNVKTPKDFESLFHRIARRSSRPYDVPQIECPASEDGVDRFACPTPNKEGRYRCIEDHELCNGFIACPNAEDEDRKLCMFYKTTKAHLDVLADAMLRVVRGRF